MTIEDGESLESRVRRVVEERRQVVNNAIPELLPVHEPERLYAASRHLLDAGGKRLRPTVLLLAAESIAEVDPMTVPYTEFPTSDGDRVNVLVAAVSIEVIHLFTLIHDDIMDDDDLRRGVAAVHREYDLETAILAGDTLYSKAFEILMQSGATSERSNRTMDTIARTCTQICEGQAFDVSFEGREDVTVDEYLEMIELKTAVLFGAAATVPAILLGASDREVEALYQFGIDIGKGFQIQDDVLDLVGSTSRIGKQRGSDLVEGKRTLVTLHARENGVNIGSLIDADRLAAEKESTESLIDDAVDQLADAGSIEYARQTAREHIERGKRRLEILPESMARDRLHDVADFLIERDR